jgi:hypothetical protein
VERLAPSEAEKVAAYGVRAGDVGAPATPGVMAPTVWGGGGWRKRETEKPLDDGDTSGSTGTLAVNRSGRAGLKEGAVVAVEE